MRKKTKKDKLPKKKIYKKEDGSLLELKPLTRKNEIKEISVEDVIKTIKKKYCKIYIDENEYKKLINGYIWSVIDVMRKSCSNIYLGTQLRITRDKPKKTTLAITKYRQKNKLTKEC
jgi:hypothetical protein